MNWICTHMKFRSHNSFRLLITSHKILIISFHRKHPDFNTNFAFNALILHFGNVEKFLALFLYATFRKQIRPNNRFLVLNTWFLDDYVMLWKCCADQWPSCDETQRVDYDTKRGTLLYRFFIDGVWRGNWNELLKRE